MTFSLPLITLFFTLVLLTNGSLLRMRTLSLFSKATLHQKEGRRAERNLAAARAWKTHRKKKPSSSSQKHPVSPFSSPPKPRTEEEKKTFTVNRFHRRTCPLSTLNLTPETDSPFIRALGNALFIHLYQHTSPFKNNPSYLTSLAPLVIDALCTSPQPTLIQKLAPLRTKHPILYTLLHGTAHYTLATHEGYPPLSHFFSSDPDRSKPIHFHFASYPLMHTLFGDPLSEVIEAFEDYKWKKRSKYPYISTDEWFALLCKEDKSDLHEIWQPYLHFSTVYLIEEKSNEM